MGKLIKYEFIKNRMALIISAGVFTLFEVFFLVGFLLETATVALIGALGLALLGWFVFIVPLVICCKTYTNELSNKVGCLVYMTPNSTYKIVGSKYLFSAIMFVGFGLLLGAYGALDALYLVKKFDLSEDFWKGFKDAFSFFGLSVDEILYKLLGYLVTFIIILVVLVALVYLAYTFSSTILQNGKAKGFLSFLLFIGLFVLFVYLNNKMPEINSQTESVGEVFLSLLPRIGLCISLIIVSFFGSGYMLSKKINL